MTKRRRRVLFALGIVVLAVAGVAGPGLVEFFRTFSMNRKIDAARAAFEAAAAALPQVEIPPSPPDSPELARLLTEIDNTCTKFEAFYPLLLEPHEHDAEQRKILAAYLPELRPRIARLAECIDADGPIPFGQAMDVTGIVREFVVHDANAPEKLLLDSVRVVAAAWRRTRVSGLLGFLAKLNGTRAAAQRLRNLSARIAPARLLAMLDEVDSMPSIGPPQRAILEEFQTSVPLALEKAATLEPEARLDYLRTAARTYRELGRLRGPFDVTPEAAAALLRDRGRVASWFYRSFVRQTAIVRLTRAGLLVLGYRRNTGSWPATLADCGAEAVRDPYTGKPFLLETTPTGPLIRCDVPGKDAKDLLESSLAWKLPTPPGK